MVARSSTQSEDSGRKATDAVRLLTYGEAAARLGSSPTFLRKLINDGAIRAVRRGSHWRRIEQGEVEGFIERHRAVVPTAVTAPAYPDGVVRRRETVVKSQVPKKPRSRRRWRPADGVKGDERKLLVGQVTRRL